MNQLKTENFTEFTFHQPNTSKFSLFPTTKTFGSFDMIAIRDMSQKVGSTTRSHEGVFFIVMDILRLAHYFIIFHLYFKLSEILPYF
jgi:hypothetical protein